MREKTSLPWRKAHTLGHWRVSFGASGPEGGPARPWLCSKVMATSGPTDLPGCPLPTPLTSTSGGIEAFSSQTGVFLSRPHAPSPHSLPGPFPRKISQRRAGRRHCPQPELGGASPLVKVSPIRSVPHTPPPMGPQLPQTPHHRAGLQPQGKPGSAETWYLLRTDLCVYTHVQACRCGRTRVSGQGGSQPGCHQMALASPTRLLALSKTL